MLVLISSCSSYPLPSFCLSSQRLPFCRDKVPPSRAEWAPGPSTQAGTRRWPFSATASAAPEKPPPPRTPKQHHLQAHQAHLQFCLFSISLWGWLESRYGGMRMCSISSETLVMVLSRCGVNVAFSSSEICLHQIHSLNPHYCWLLTDNCVHILTVLQHCINEEVSRRNTIIQAFPVYYDVARKSCNIILRPYDQARQTPVIKLFHGICKKNQTIQWHQSYVQMDAMTVHCHARIVQYLEL